MKANVKAVILRWVFPLIGLLLLALFIFLGATGKEKKNAEEVIENEIFHVVEKHATMIRTELLDIQNAGELILSLIERENATTPESLSRYLQAVIDKTEANAAVYVAGNGLAVNQDGEKVKLTDRSWFQEDLLEADEPLYLLLGEDETEAEEAILIMVPGSDGAGAVYIWYSVENLKNLMVMNEDFDRPVIGMLLDADGNILVRTGIASDFTTEMNLWANLNEAGDEVAAAKAEIQNGSSGALRASADNESRTLVYVPLSIGEWQLMAGLDQAYVDRREKNLWGNTSKVLGLVLTGVVIFAIFFVITNISVRMKNEKNSQVLKEKADTDLLTGLNNKLATERKIKEYMEEAPDSLAMMFLLDIDNFKKINDTMGHAFGDEVLRTLGKKISANFRVTDIIGRTGGDEFTIFLKALKNDSNTLNEANKLINFFQHFQVGEYVKYSATASIGAAVFPADGKDFETLYKAADQALYKAKKRGKNQLAFYDDRDRK